MSIIEKFEENGFTVEIHHDMDAESPREWSCVGRMALNARGYRFPNDDGIAFDSIETMDEFVRTVIENHDAHPDLILPVYMYEHGSVALKAGERTYPFNDEWDSGTIGITYVTNAAFKEEWLGLCADPEEAKQKALKALAGEVKNYGEYVNGECYGYVVKDFDGEIVDDCWGFVGGRDYVEEEARSAARMTARAKKCSGHLDRLSGSIQHDGVCPIHAETGGEDSLSSRLRVQ